MASLAHDSVPAVHPLLAVLVDEARVSLEHALQAFESIEAGGVIMNDVPTYRIDHMPYGGVKDSGLSREGLRYAIEDMTEPRLAVFNRGPGPDA
jgi:acyl-CoA reductase-like NAD-dependent aldehyde dehydrogenase